LSFCCTRDYGTAPKESPLGTEAQADKPNDLAVAPGRKFALALHSWRAVEATRGWFRRLDEEHLTAKCFLLERFLHDVIDGASDPSLVLAFVAK